MYAYVDCGLFKGSLFARFIKNRPQSHFVCYGFECNPHFTRFNYGNEITVYHKAVWVHDGTLEFFTNRARPTIQGHSVFGDKRTGNLDKKPIEVQCIDFDVWLKSKFQPGDEVHVKMNIEGAEYPVLEHCVDNGSISLITFLYVQWHYNKIPSIGPDRHRKLLDRLNKVSGLTVYPGYGRI